MATKDDKGNLHSEQNGRFVEKDDMEAIYNSSPPEIENNLIPRSPSEDLDLFLGEEFKGIKGADAIEKLLSEKRGHIINAFEREEVGGIDLIWGNKNGGICHVIYKRNRLLEKGVGKISGIDMVRKIPDIIEKGTFNQDNKGRINIDYMGYRVGIMPAYFDKKVNWIVTALEIWT